MATFALAVTPLKRLALAERFPETRLTPDGTVPHTPGSPLTSRDFDRCASVVGKTWNHVRVLDANRGIPRPTEDLQERASRVWLLSHAAFFPLYAVLADVYRKMSVESSERSRVGLARRAGQLNRGAGALIRYGIDFDSPVETYAWIREQMPVAFSGYALREARLVELARMEWTKSVGTTNSSEAVRIERDGRRDYHVHHQAVMRAVVPNGVSLLKEYAKTNAGVIPAITDAQFEEYDWWFRIRRAPMSDLQFIFATCRTVRRVVLDITNASGLDTAVIADVCDGFRGLLCELGNWLGPIPPGSVYAPENRGW